MSRMNYITCIIYNIIAIYKVYSGLCIMYDIIEAYKVHKVFISMLLVSGLK